MPDLVAVVLPEMCSPFEMSVACEVFGYDRPELHDPWYRFRTCGVYGRTIDSGMGFTIQAETDLDGLADADTIVVPAWERMDEPPPDALLQALKDGYERGARMLSFCNGAFALAHAGLLDGKAATTHWRFSDLFADTFPQVDLQRDALYVDAGQVLTSAGTAAAIDLCMYVVRQDLGAEVANALARRMVIPPHREGGQAQFMEAPLPTCPDNDPMQASLAWALNHLAEPLTVEVLARRAALSPRTFARKFRQATGETPLQWLLHQRVLLAQRLLETTDDSIEEIAGQCGFGSATALRDHFVRRTRTSPSGYRRTFQAAAS
jgi:transcriptional regulator GlxA family with amidase domain